MNRIDQPLLAGRQQNRNDAPPGAFLTPAYRRLSKTPLVGFCVLQNGQLSYANQQFASLLGYDSPEKLTGMTLADRIHPEDRGRFEKEIGGQSALAESIDMTFRIRRSDGTDFRAGLRGDISTYNGAPAHFGCLTDLSAMAAIKRYRDKYETILSKVEDAVAEVNLKGDLTFYTDAACRMWKVSKKEWIGKNYRDFMDAQWAAVAREAYGKVYQTARPGENIIYQIIRNDGQRIFVEDTITAIKDSTGAITGFRAVSRDITARRETERQMAEHRVHLEAVFRSVQDAIITVDPQMRVTEVNVSAERICGFSAQQIKGKRVPQSSAHCKGACYEVLRQTVETQEEITEFRVDCGLAQRQPQMVSVSCAPLKDADGSILGAVMINRDISLLRDLERQLGQRHHFLNIVGKSKRMQDIYTLIEDLADMETTVLITGESGTGKEMVARALHQSGHRAFKPFVAVHCSALAEGVLESELFGHVKGAFTGALEDKRGRIETAHGGTLLLDEIGDISPLIQLKLLRVLQEKEFERVGETAPRKADLRIIACTNTNLKQKTAIGEFRQDLYYRLKVVEIRMPPLRERNEDIPLLVDCFCRLYNDQFAKGVTGVSDEVMTRFIEYPWPGNVRELKHVMESAFVLCEEQTITKAHLPHEIRNFTASALCAVSEADAKAKDEKNKILQALRAAHWNKSKASKMLGFSRQTLYKKLSAYGIVTNPASRV